MKKLRSIMAIMLAAVMLTGCAGKKTESGLEFSESPFSNNSSDTTSEPQADSYEELFGKYQTGSIRFGNYSIQGSSAVEYNGGNIELSFDMDTTGNQYEVEAGFMAFINGIPQRLSLNAGESSELVRVSQQPDQSGKATLSLTPTITEELSGEETLQLKIINIFNPSYKPAGSFTGFGNAHLGQSLLELDIKAISPLAVSQDVFEPISDRGESVLITDDAAKQYGIKKPGENSATTISIHDAQTKDAPLSLRGGKLDAELLIYGSETYNYRVYVYVNHNRVRFNGGDYFETETKNGYLNVFKPELENINERDIIYAIAIPTNSDTGSMTVRKSGSVLVLDEDDIQIESVPETPIDPPEIPPETSENEQLPGEKNTNIYDYNPVGYIDDEQRYLLLSRYLFKSHDIGFYDYIVYDETEDRVCGTFEFEGEGNNDINYGDGVITVDITNWTDIENGLDTLRFVVYNEKFEPIKEIYNSDIPDIYSLQYFPSKKCWYFNKDDGLYRANEDFSDEVRITDFWLSNFYIIGDRMIYYKVIHNLSDPKNNADIFGIMDLDGNVISETKVAPYGAGEFRLVKAGDKICFMSEFHFDTYGLLREPMDGIIFYDCKTGEQKTFCPEDDNENTFCSVSPDGKHLVTGILLKENYYTNKDHIIKVYDMNTLELLESETLGTGNTSFLAMSVYNDRVMLADLGTVTYMFKTQ